MVRAQVPRLRVLTDGYVGDEGGGGERAGGAARQLGEVAVGHEVLEGGSDADVVDPQEPAPGEALCQHIRSLGDPNSTDSFVEGEDASSDL